MSRFADYDNEEDYPNAWALWQKRVDLAMAGRRGKQALIDLRAALLALPERRLIEGALCTVGGDRRMSGEVAAQGPGVCAMGAYLWHRNVKAGMDPAAAFESLPTLDGEDEDLSATAALGRDAGLAYALAWEVSYTNDETFGSLSPEERFDQFIVWIDLTLAQPVPTRPAPKVKTVRQRALIANPEQDDWLAQQRRRRRELAHA